MADDSRSPKSGSATPPPLPPGYGVRTSQSTVKAVEPPPVVSISSQPAPQPNQAPRKKISLAQFYKAKESDLTRTSVESNNKSQTAQQSETLAPQASNHFDEETEDEFRLLPVEGKSAEKIYSEMLMAEQELLLQEKEKEERKRDIRQSVRQAMKNGALQYTTMQMFAAIIVGCLGIAFTSLFIKSVVMQLISFLLLMACVICAAMLRKTEDERLDIITRTLVLVYIATLLIGVAIS